MKRRPGEWRDIFRVFLCLSVFWGWDRVAAETRPPLCGPNAILWQGTRWFGINDEGALSDEFRKPFQELLSHSRTVLWPKQSDSGDRRFRFAVGLWTGSMPPIPEGHDFQNNG